MQVTGLMHGAPLLRRVDFPTADVRLLITHMPERSSPRTTEGLQ